MRTSTAFLLQSKSFNKYRKSKTIHLSIGIFWKIVLNYFDYAKRHTHFSSYAPALSLFKIKKCNFFYYFSEFSKLNMLVCNAICIQPNNIDSTWCICSLYTLQYNQALLFLAPPPILLCVQCFLNPLFNPVCAMYTMVH